MIVSTVKSSNWRVFKRYEIARSATKSRSTIDYQIDNDAGRARQGLPVAGYVTVKRQGCQIIYWGRNGYPGASNVILGEHGGATGIDLDTATVMAVNLP